MTFNGITNYEAVIDGEIDYYVKFVNERDLKPTITGDIYDEPEGVGEGINSYFRVNVYYSNELQAYNSPIGIDDDWYLLDGYELAYVVKCEVLKVVLL